MYINDLTYDYTMFCDFLNLSFHIIVVQDIYCYKFRGRNFLRREGCNTPT